MAISYTEEALFALLDTGSSNWGAVFNAVITQLDQGLVLSFDAGENLLEFDAVYISGEDEVSKADADNASKRPCIGIALADTDSGDSVKVLMIGWADYDDTALAALGASAGDKVYLSATAGQLTTTPVAAYPQIIGICKTDTAANITRLIVFPRRIFEVVDDSSPQLGGDLDLNEKDVVAGTSTGSKIGTASNQKLGLWGVTPVVQQAHIEDAPPDSNADAIDNADAINEILVALEAVGIVASS